MAVEEHRIELDNAPVFYRSAPFDGVPVLYLHGAPTSSADFAEFLERAGGLAPDLPGFGNSVKAGHLSYTIDSHADFIEQLLDALGIETVKLLAHDWGAGGGLIFAQRHPERIERLVLIDALPLLSGFTWPRLGAALRTNGIGQVIMGLVPSGRFKRILREAAVSPDAWSDARLGQVWEQFDHGTQRAILRMIRDASPERLERAGADLSEVWAPALVVWGEADPWLPVGFAHRYAGALPRAELRIVPGAGHWPWLAHPELVSEIADFLT